MISPIGHSSTESANRYYSPYLDHRIVFSPVTSYSNNDSSLSTNSSERIIIISPPMGFPAAESSSAGDELGSSAPSTDRITVKGSPSIGNLNEAAMSASPLGKGKAAKVAVSSSFIASSHRDKEGSKQRAAVPGFCRFEPGNRMVTVRIKAETRQHYLRLATVDIAKMYRTFSYEPRQIPRRVLTRPGKPAKNDGADNKDDDYIIRVNDVLGEKDAQYRVIDILGRGTFGQVVKCEWIQAKKLVSVKIIKNRRSYAIQSSLEADILKWLNNKVPSKDRDHIVQIFDSFHHKNHLCITYELLSYSLYDLLRYNNFRGLPMNMVKSLTISLLKSLAVLKDARVIHCDLKPDNILLKSVHSLEIKIVDYGSATHLNMPRMLTYIQSRYYRAPEVILGLPYTHAIDVWALGCVVAELFLGAPLLAGLSEHHQLIQIIDMLGAPASYMLEEGTRTDRFYNQKPSTQLSSLPSHHAWHLKSCPHDTGHRRLKLAEVIINYDGSSYGERARRQMSYQSAPRNHLSQQELQERRALVDFLHGLMMIDPKLRWTPLQAMGHPFITGELSTGPYVLCPVSTNNAPPVAEKRSTAINPADSTNAVMQTLSPPTPPIEKEAPLENGKSILPIPISTTVIPGAFQQSRNSSDTDGSQSTLRLQQRPSPCATAVGLTETPQTSPIIQPDSKKQQSAHFSSIMKKKSHEAITANASKTLQKSDITAATVFGRDVRSRRVKIDPMVKVGSKELYRMPDQIGPITGYDSANGGCEPSLYKHSNGSTAQLLNSNNSFSSTATCAEVEQQK